MVCGPLLVIFCESMSAIFRAASPIDIGVPTKGVLAGETKVLLC